MMFFILYMCVAATMAAVMNRLWSYKPKSGADVPKIAWVLLASLLWPATGPATVIYTLTTKLLDKFVKV